VLLGEARLLRRAGFRSVEMRDLRRSTPGDFSAAAVSMARSFPLGMATSRGRPYVMLSRCAGRVSVRRR